MTSTATKAETAFRVRRAGRDAGGSRQRMIDAAIDLMRGAGLTGAGINEIVRASEAPKGSVYHFFPSGKHQIVAEALTEYSGRVMEFIDAGLASRTSAPQKVRALFDAFARRVEAGGFRRSCAFGAVCLDLDEDTDSLRIIVAGAFDAWMQLIARHFDFGDARRTRSFAGLLLTAIEGAYVRARAEQSGRPFIEAGAWLAELATPSSVRAMRARKRA